MHPLRHSISGTTRLFSTMFLQGSIAAAIQGLSSLFPMINGGMSPRAGLQERDHRIIHNSPLSPDAVELLGDLTNGCSSGRQWSEVPCPGQIFFSGKHLCCKKHVPGKRFQHMLPWPYRLRTPDFKICAGRYCPDCIGNDPILCPVTASDHISSPYRGNQDITLLREIGVTI